MNSRQAGVMACICVPVQSIVNKQDDVRTGKTSQSFSSPQKQKMHGTGSTAKWKPRPLCPHALQGLQPFEVLREQRRAHRAAAPAAPEGDAAAAATAPFVNAPRTSAGARQRQAVQNSDSDMEWQPSDEEHDEGEQAAGGGSARMRGARRRQGHGCAALPADERQSCCSCVSHVRAYVRLDLTFWSIHPDRGTPQSYLRFVLFCTVSH